MSRFLKIVVVALMAVFLSACGDKSPSDVTQDAIEKMMSGNTKGALKHFDLGEDGENPQATKMMEGKIEGAAKASEQRHGKFKKITILKEEINGDSAVVEYEMEFASGHKEKERAKLVKNKDKWQISAL